MAVPFSFTRMIKKFQSVKVSHDQGDAPFVLQRALFEAFIQIPSSKQIVIVCIGTDRSTGDSLGPLIGSKLQELSRNVVHLYGTLDEPVHAVNLQETVEAIQTRFSDPFIVAIDACLGQVSSIGQIQLAEGPVKPGAGVHKDLQPVGDMHITGIVNVGGFMEYFVLQNTRLSLVMKMADLIARSLYFSLKNVRSIPLPVSEPPEPSLLSPQA